MQKWRIRTKKNRDYNVEEMELRKPADKEEEDEKEKRTVNVGKSTEEEEEGQTVYKKINGNRRRTGTELKTSYESEKNHKRKKQI